MLNKRLLGEFNPEDWNPKLKMNWGGHMVEQYLIAAILLKPDRKFVLKMLKKAHIKKFLSAAPSGLSPLDVLEFYNNSKVYTGV